MSTGRTSVVLDVSPLRRIRPQYWLSALAHVLLGAALVLVPHPEPSSGLDSDFMMAELADEGLELGGGEEATAEPTPPAEPQPQPDVARVETRDVQQPPRDEIEPDVVPDVTEEEEKEPEEPLRATSDAPAPGPARPDTAAPPTSGTTGGPGGPATGEAVSGGVVGGDPRWGWYNRLVKARLMEVWRRPALEHDAPMTVTVIFDIRRDGTVQGVEITHPSGAPSLDRSALRAVTDAAPLPPFPSSIRDPVKGFRWNFRLHPSES